MGKRKNLESRLFFLSILDDQCFKNYFCDSLDDAVLNNVTHMAESHILIP